MKKKSSYLLILAQALMAGCLSDSGYTDIINGSGKMPVVSLFGTQNGRYSVAVPISPAETIPLTVTVGSATQDLTVNLKVDGQEAVDAYNAQLAEEARNAGKLDSNGKPKYDAFELLPASLYTLPSPSVTIPVGSLDGQFIISVNSSQMSLTKKYCLPVSIESTSDPNAIIARNFKSILIYVQVKNKYDGKYETTGTMVDSAVPSITGYYPWKTALVTDGADRVILYDDDGGFAVRHLISSSGSVSYYGFFGLVINFDPATNKVTSVSNYYGTGTPPTSSNGRSAQLDPSGKNYWDPTTKTLSIKYWMNQPGATHRTSFDETYIYKGSR